MFNIVDFPPGFGECTFCKLHDCGVNEEGEQYWLHSAIELDKGGSIVIGYKCAKLMADNMNITVKVVEKQILLTPSDEQIGDFVRKAISVYGPSPILPMIEAQINGDRESLKRILDDKGVKYFKGASDEVLADLVAKND